MEQLPVKVYCMFLHTHTEKLNIERVARGHICKGLLSSNLKYSCYVLCSFDLVLCSSRVYHQVWYVLSSFQDYKAQ